MQIRKATVEDAESLLKIYSYYVENTAISFEYETPSLAEFKGRIAKTLGKYPYLVLEDQGRIMGYTKVGEFHRCGYKFGRWYNMIWMEKIIAA